jgi:hypothetical protein
MPRTTEAYRTDHILDVSYMMRRLSSAVLRYRITLLSGAAFEGSPPHGVRCSRVPLGRHPEGCVGSALLFSVGATSVAIGRAWCPGSSWLKPLPPLIPRCDHSCGAPTGRSHREPSVWGRAGILRGDVPEAG